MSNVDLNVYKVSSSGMVHQGPPTTLHTHCSGGSSRNRKRMRVVSIDVAATKHSFCRKCFPAGKPDGLVRRLDDMLKRRAA